MAGPLRPSHRQSPLQVFQLPWEPDLRNQHDPVKQFSGRIHIGRFKHESESGVKLIRKRLGARIQDVFGKMSLATLP